MRSRLVKKATKPDIPTFLKIFFFFIVTNPKVSPRTLQESSSSSTILINLHPRSVRLTVVSAQDLLTDWLTDLYLVEGGLTQIGHLTWTWSFRKNTRRELRWYLKSPHFLWITTVCIDRVLERHFVMWSNFFKINRHKLVNTN